MRRVLRSFTVAAVLVAGVALLGGARPVFAYQELRCEEGYLPRPVSIAADPPGPSGAFPAWAYDCEPRGPLLRDVPEVVTVRGEVGLYLTRFQLRVFHVDFVAGTWYALALGVRGD